MVVAKKCNCVALEESDSTNQYPAIKIASGIEIIIANTLPNFASDMRAMNVMFNGTAKASGKSTSTDSLFLVLTSSHDLNANIPNINIAIFTVVGLGVVFGTIYP